MATPNQSSSDEAKTNLETLIPELPRERGWIVDEDIHLLNGFCIVNRATYNHDDMMHPLLNSNPHELVPSLLTYPTNPRPPESLLFHTHFAYSSLPEQIRNSSCRIVYVFRDPKDVFVSFWHFFNKLRPKEWQYFV
nr:flavonol sulfotransferase-like [Ipomoea trifida]